MWSSAFAQLHVGRCCAAPCSAIVHPRNAALYLLQVYAFSSENWKRPAAEVAFLMALFQRTLDEQLQELHEAVSCVVGWLVGG
jgi:undecaprenyl diphosphate synthase